MLKRPVPIEGDMWQEMPNATWFIEEKIKCDVCKKKVEHIVEFVFPRDNISKLYCNTVSCFTQSQIDCRKYWAKYPDTDDAYFRGIEFKNNKVKAHG